MLYLNFGMNITSLNALLEILKSGHTLQKVLISQSRKGSKINLIKDLCRQKGIVYQIVPQNIVDHKAGIKNQGIFAQLPPVSFFQTSDILKNIKSGVILILDRIHDTGNMGAIIRSAVAAQVDGVIISLRESAPINETVLKTSAGSLIKANIVLSKNLGNDIRILKKHDFWIIGTDVKKGIPYYKCDFKTKSAIIVGNEEHGISPLLKKNSDLLISIPHSNDVESLNVSVSTGIILFEIMRQKYGKI